MTRTGLRSIFPSTLVTLSLVVSVSAVADATGAGALTSTISRRLSRPDSDRHQVAQILACLTQAARQLHGPGADGAAPPSQAIAPRAIGLVLQMPGPSLRTAVRDGRQRPPAAPWLAHLIDLPPPACLGT